QRVPVRGLKAGPGPGITQGVAMNPFAPAGVGGLSRREVLCRIGGGFGALGLASLFADAGLLAAPAPTRPAGRVVNPLAPRPPHFPARARRVIFLFMNGGPSHVDTFDPKPALATHAGKPLPDSFTARTGRKGGGKLMPSPF